MVSLVRWVMLYCDAWCTAWVMAALHLVKLIHDAQVWAIFAWCTALSYTDAWCTSLRHGCTVLSHGTQDLDMLMHDAQPHWLLDAQHWAIIEASCTAHIHWAILMWLMRLLCLGDVARPLPWFLGGGHNQSECAVWTTLTRRTTCESKAVLAFLKWIWISWMSNTSTTQLLSAYDIPPEVKETVGLDEDDPHQVDVLGWYLRGMKKPGVSLRFSSKWLKWWWQSHI